MTRTGTILIVEDDADDLYLMLRALRRLNETISGSGFDFNISASFGVTDTTRSGYTLEKLIADADEAMYQSKHNGRNRISVYTEPEEADSNEPIGSSGSQADLPLFTRS